mmetsp:Transcript_85721/g.227788  ORF Transcript_85721/g.227788 Transcript_85721/m.227788 type:complete len:259 (+) Transcript_85721:1008-1784(+)
MPSLKFTSSSLPVKPSCWQRLMFISALCSLTMPRATAELPLTARTLSASSSNSSLDLHSLMALSMIPWHCSMVMPWLIALFSKSLSTCSSSLLRLKTSRTRSFALFRFWFSSPSEAVAPSNWMKPPKPSRKPPCASRCGACTSAMSFFRSSSRLGPRSVRTYQSCRMFSFSPMSFSTFLQISAKSASLNFRYSDWSWMSALPRTSSANFADVSAVRFTASRALSHARKRSGQRRDSVGLGMTAVPVFMVRAGSVPSSR